MRVFILTAFFIICHHMAFATSEFNPKAAQLQISCDNTMENKSIKFYVVNEDAYWVVPSLSFDALFYNQDSRIDGDRTYSIFHLYSGTPEFGFGVGASDTTNNSNGNYSDFGFNFEDISKNGFSKKIAISSPDKTRKNSCTISLVKKVEIHELPIFLFEGVGQESQ